MYYYKQFDKYRISLYICRGFRNREHNEICRLGGGLAQTHSEWWAMNSRGVYTGSDSRDEDTPMLPKYFPNLSRY